MATVHEHIQNLHKRLEALERGPTDYALSPNYLTITPTGLVIAQFSGIFTGGIVLPEQATPTTQPTGQVLWTNDGTSTGTVGGRDTTYTTAGIPPQIQREADAIADSPTGVSLTQIAALDDNATARAYVTAIQTARGTTAAARVTVGATTFNLLRQDGTSVFPVLPNAVPLRTQVLGGFLGAGNTVPTGTSSSGFTVSKSSVGNYSINFTTSFTDTGYWLGLAVEGSATSNHKIVENTRGVGSVNVALSAADVATDLGWSFLCIGVY